MIYEALLDTSFFIRLLNEKDPLHNNTLEYFHYFIDNNLKLNISTISVAEFCVFSKFDNLPLKFLKILDFNLEHAKRAAEFAKIIYTQKKTGNLEIEPRILIPNDTKLFAQIDVEPKIKYFVTSDKRSKVIYKHLNINLLDNDTNTDFNIIDINNKVNDFEIELI